MPKIVETARIAQEAGVLWAEIGAFGAVGAWHPMLARLDTEGERPGELRTAHGKDGTRQVERLRETAPGQRAYRYEIVSTTMPVANYAAEFQVEDDGDRASKVVWQAEFDVMSDDEAGVVKGIRAFLRAGLASLTERYGKAPSAKLIGINHVALEVGDLDAALAFLSTFVRFRIARASRWHGLPGYGRPIFGALARTQPAARQGTALRPGRGRPGQTA